eukprot:3778644-Prymnesium_polylepis.4
MKFMIPPGSQLKSRWDVFIIFLVLCSLFLVPIQLTYRLESTFWSIFEIGTDSLFIVDVVLSFFCAYEYENIVVTQPRRIADRYLKGWFTIDVLSSFPIDKLLTATGALGDDGDSHALRLNRLIRLTRMFKLMRIMRLYRLTRGDSYAWEVIRELFNPSTMRFFIFTFFATSVLNFIGCIYWLVIDFEWEEARLGIDDALANNDANALEQAQDYAERLGSSQWFPPEYVMDAAGLKYTRVLAVNITDVSSLPVGDINDVGVVFLWCFFWATSLMSGYQVRADCYCGCSSAAHPHPADRAAADCAAHTATGFPSFHHCGEPALSLRGDARIPRLFHLCRLCTPLSCRVGGQVEGEGAQDSLWKRKLDLFVRLNALCYTRHPSRVYRRR